MRERPELDALVKASVAREAAKTPFERALGQAKQRRSYVVSEMQFDDNDEPSGMTEQQALALYEHLPEGALLAELERLMSASQYECPAAQTEDLAAFNRAAFDAKKFMAASGDASARGSEAGMADEGLAETQAVPRRRHEPAAASPAAPPSATDARVGEIVAKLREASKQQEHIAGNMRGDPEEVYRFAIFLDDAANALDALSARVGELEQQVDEGAALLQSCLPQIRPSTPAVKDGEIIFGHLVEKIDAFIARACIAASKGRGRWQRRKSMVLRTI